MKYSNTTGWFKHKNDAHPQWLIHNDAKTRNYYGTGIDGSWLETSESMEEEEYNTMGGYIKEFCVRATQEDIERITALPEYVGMLHHLVGINLDF
jgi:hypothetical protein